LEQKLLLILPLRQWCWKEVTNRLRILAKWRRRECSHFPGRRCSARWWCRTRCRRSRQPEVYFICRLSITFMVTTIKKLFIKSLRLCPQDTLCHIAKAYLKNLRRNRVLQRLFQFGRKFLWKKVLLHRVRALMTVHGGSSGLYRGTVVFNRGCSHQL